MRTRLVFLGCATVMLVVVVVAVCVPRREEPLSDEALARLTGATPPINYCETCQECVGNNPHCSDDSGCTSYTEGRACPTVTSDTTVYGAQKCKDTTWGDALCTPGGSKPMECSKEATDCCFCSSDPYSDPPSYPCKLTGNPTYTYKITFPPTDSNVCFFIIPPPDDPNWSGATLVNCSTN